MVQRQLFLTSTIFFTTVFALSLPFIILSIAAGTGSFTASATVTNSAPTASVLAQTIAGQAAGTASVYILFNASDANGNSDLNDSSASVVINKTSETTRQNASCTGTVLNSSSKQYNCTLTLYYYDAAGTWTINATIADNSGNRVSNTSSLATVSTLDAIAIVSSSISFSGSPGTNNNAASPNPQQINNTGNQNYNSINLTAYSFTSGANVLSVGNVTVNVSNSGGLGQVLVNNTEMAINGTTLPKGAGSLEDLYFWLDVPASQASGSYSSQANWAVEAIQ